MITTFHKIDMSLFLSKYHTTPGALICQWARAPPKMPVHATATLYIQNLCGQTFTTIPVFNFLLLMCVPLARVRVVSPAADRILPNGTTSKPRICVSDIACSGIFFIPTIIKHYSLTE